MKLPSLETRQDTPTGLLYGVDVLAPGISPQSAQELITLCHEFLHRTEKWAHAKGADRELKP